MSNAESLENKKPLDTYKDLMHMGNSNNGVTALPRNIYDGAGNILPIRVSSNQVWLDQPTYVSSSTLDTCTFSPAAGKSTSISDPSLQGVGVSWGSIDRSTLGKQYRKVKQITVKDKDVVLKPEDLTDFIVLNISADVSSFVISPYSGYAKDVVFSREIHVLVFANGFNVSFAPANDKTSDTKVVFWPNGNIGSEIFPNTTNGDFGKNGKDPCLLRFVYFNSVTIGGDGPVPAWISSIIGSALQIPNG